MTEPMEAPRSRGKYNQGSCSQERGSLVAFLCRRRPYVEEGPEDEYPPAKRQRVQLDDAERQLLAQLFSETANATELQPVTDPLVDDTMNATTLLGTCL